MLMNTRAFFCLCLANPTRLSQSTRWILAIGREFRMIPGLRIYDVFRRVALHVVSNFILLLSFDRGSVKILKLFQRTLITFACLILGSRATTWLNALDGKLHYQCPPHQSISHVFSIHNNGAEDRQFSLSCASLPVDLSDVTESCFWTASK